MFKTKKTEADTESEERDIEDEESDFESHDTSERDGCYRPITTSPKDEPNLYADGERNSGETQTENMRIENEKIRRSNRESKKPNRYGKISYTRNVWV